MTGGWKIRKRLRMTLDFEVEVEDLTDESLRRHYGRFGNAEELVGDTVWANLSRQGRLQRALMEDEKALGRYLTYVAVCEVDASTGSRLGEVFGVGMQEAEEEIMGPIFPRLEETDARYFMEACAEGVLFESVEALSRSVRVRMVAARIDEQVGDRPEEWREVAVEDPSEKESDNLM